MAHEDIFKEFCEWSPWHAVLVVEYKPWGSASILIRLSSGAAYKAKRYGEKKFILQPVTEDDINRKYGIK